MIEAVHIKNFRSIREVTVNLQQVNLLIGANNSGKTNFLKVFGFVKDAIRGNVKGTTTLPFFIFNKNIETISTNPLIVDFVFSFNENQYFFRLKIIGINEIQEFIGLVPPGTNDFKTFFENNDFALGHLRVNDREFKYLIPMSTPQIEIDDKFIIASENALQYFKNELFKTDLYLIDPGKITYQQQPRSVVELNSNLENILPFLHTMKEDETSVFDKIITDFKACVKDFKQINFPSDKESVGYIKLQFTDRFGQKYLADQVSEGVLYFLALLAIIHQPNPPKILLLEEPERGIHPTRITEVVEFIFRLAEEKDIQVIMSSHHPLIVEEFKDIPESIFVFDKVDGETKIRNLQSDIIEPEDLQREKSGLPKSNYTSSLSSHWAVGLIGGIPA